MLRDIFTKIASCLYIIYIKQANVTDELEERIEILEDTVLVIEQDVEELENEDALINVRLFDIEMDVFDNENAIEGITSRLNFIDFVYTSIVRQFVITIKNHFIHCRSDRQS